VDGEALVKVRIGVGTGGAGVDATTLARLADDLVELRFDSLWLSEVLTAPGLDPLIGLAWAGAHHPGLKLGTTMLLPGRNVVRLAKELASLDALSGGRLLVTFVPGIPRGAERDAIGVAPAARGEVMDAMLPVLRRLWAGEEVSHHGLAGDFDGVSVRPLPTQQPLEAWSGGMVASSLERCGRYYDGWLPSLCTPEEALAGRRVVESAAMAAERQISDEHFGVSIGYAREPLDDRTLAAMTARARGRQMAELIPIGLAALRETLDRFIEVGFSKFVLRPIVPPAVWRDELETLAGGVLDLQT
jgi:probable F420-dependent oxidoreductase